MTAFENLSTSQKLRASLHRDVRAICTESLHLLGMEMTKSAMETVAELVYKKLSLYGTDLEAFAKHAKRNTVNAEDVKLMVRRNPSLFRKEATTGSEKSQLKRAVKKLREKTHLNLIQPSNPSAKDKRRKTVSSTTAKQFATPLTKPKALRPNTEGKRIVQEDKRHSDETSKEDEEKTVEESRNALGGSSKDDEIERTVAGEVELMSVDDTIDLTFD